MSISEQLNGIIEDLSEASNDAGKFDRGNAQAGKRVRKAAQEARVALKDLRDDVQDIKKKRAQA